MLLLYTAGNCDAVPGGCPTGIVIPTPPPPPTCQPPFIQTNPIQVNGGSGEGGKIAPPNPVVIGQDPERRGVDVQVNVLIPPVVYHYFETVPHTELVCVSNAIGNGAGCPDHPSNPRWDTEINIWYECVEHTQVFPDHLEYCAGFHQPDSCFSQLDPDRTGPGISRRSPAPPGLLLFISRARVSPGKPECVVDNHHPAYPDS